MSAESRRNVAHALTVLEEGLHKILESKDLFDRAGDHDMVRRLTSEFQALLKIYWDVRETYGEGASR